MPNLQRINITFNTHNDNRDHDTVLHVFVKNRSNTSSTPEGATTFIANLLAFQESAALGPNEINPYLGFAQSLSQGSEFDDPSTHQFDIPLRATPIPLEEIILPVVNIHILPNGHDRWIFDYRITFFFDDGRSFSSTSNTNGVTGIILDQDNKDYSGICVENPFITLPPVVKPQTDALLTQVWLEFSTHNDNKDSDTQLNVHIVNRLSATTSQDIAVGVNLLPGQEFPDPGYKKVVFSKTTLPLASNTIRLQDIVLPVVNINIGPNGNDRWIFDYRVTYFFSDGRAFSSSTGGIILDQDNHKYTGVYQGNPFPTFTLGKPALTLSPVDHVTTPKTISLGFLQKKLDEFINKREGTGSQYPPLKKLRLHNTGVFGGTLPQSYSDLQSIDANPPAPGTILPDTFKEGVRYTSSPAELGQLTGFLGIGDTYLNDINSNMLRAAIDVTKATPLTVEIDFETGGPPETAGGVGGMDFTTFTITLNLTLRFDSNNSRIDLMGWVDDINHLTPTPISISPPSFRVTGQFLGEAINTIVPSVDDFKSALIDRVIHVVVVTPNAVDFGGKFQKDMRGRIFDKLSHVDTITKTSLRDSINATVNSWLLGGEIESGNTSPSPYPNPCRIQSVSPISDGNLTIAYTGPQHNFLFTTPAGWPSPANPHPAFDFSPGTLANIDHIVVLTMENRSFDHILGYLSLPPNKGGQGRTDVDGLKGNEFNSFNGTNWPSFALAAGDTIFAPDPPHDPDPVRDAINGGRMDGFVKSYAEESGSTVAPRIMGYHTAANVPVYDALTRDFAICQRWFAAHPGPTFCNRFYELTGRLNIDAYGFWELTNSSPMRPLFTDTIFDHLSTQKVSWKYFEHGYCFLRFFERHTFDSANIATFDDPVNGFLSLAQSGNLPSVSFIDPHFIELPPDGNCDGPPADIKEGQRLVKKIVEAVVASPKWEKTLLIITYDEHGGFFDHVPPPKAAKISPESLDTYGVRVPTFIVSPWMKGGTVFGKDAAVVTTGGGGSTTTAGTPAADTGTTPVGGVSSPLQSLYFDHTSILKTIARRFMSSNPPYMGARYENAKDLSMVLGNALRPGQFRPFIPYYLTYGASKMCLDVPGGSNVAGTALWQFSPNQTGAQEFRFEDAGDGFFYVRTHAGNLYLTADVPAGANTGAGQTFAAKQDVKYPAGATGPHNPDFQRWKFGASGLTTVNRDNFSISCAALPGKVLQPAGGSLLSTAAVVLGDPTGTHIGVLVLKNPWQVISPLLGNSQDVLHP